MGIAAYLANHENLVWLRKLGKLLQGRHESLVIMPPPGGVNEHNIIPLLVRVRHRILRNGCRILPVSFLVQFHLPALARRKLLEVPHMHGQLLDCARPERVARGNEHSVLVLQKEVADLREVRGLADAVDADDGEDVGARLAEGGHGRGCDGVDLAEEVEGGGRGEHLGEGGFHGGLDAGVDAWGLWMLASCDDLCGERMRRGGLTLEVTGLDAEELLLDALA